MFTTAPRPRSTMPGSTACVTRVRASTLSRTRFRASASSTSWK
uniref:Uncharacterized protein n=1 Tax=Arundo donax TaxID=35708 RepID=A0A0A9AL32_ARUDO